MYIFKKRADAAQYASEFVKKYHGINEPVKGVHFDVYKEAGGWFWEVIETSQPPPHALSKRECIPSRCHTKHKPSPSFHQSLL